MEINKQLIAFASFILGVLAASLFFMSGVGISGYVVSQPSNNLELIPTPSDYIKESDLNLYSNRLIIDLPNISISPYSNTLSMAPLISNSSLGIRVKPKSQFDIAVGDIVSFSYQNMTLVHRVVEISSDNIGIYYITRGDNSPSMDKEKLRFSDIQWKLVGILY